VISLAVQENTLMYSRQSKLWSVSQWSVTSPQRPLSGTIIRPLHPWFTDDWRLGTGDSAKRH